MRTRTFKGRIKGVIVGGDFNTNHDSQFGDDRTIAIMEEAGFHNTWTGVPREDRLSWRGSDRFEPTTFDYIFTKDLPETPRGSSPSKTAPATIGRSRSPSRSNDRAGPVPAPSIIRLKR